MGTRALRWELFLPVLLQRVAPSSATAATHFHETPSWYPIAPNGRTYSSQYLGWVPVARLAAPQTHYGRTFAKYTSPYRANDFSQHSVTNVIADSQAFNMRSNITQSHRNAELSFPQIFGATSPLNPPAPNVNVAFTPVLLFPQTLSAGQQSSVRYVREVLRDIFQTGIDNGEHERSNFPRRKGRVGLGYYRHAIIQSEIINGPIQTNPPNEEGPRVFVPTRQPPSDPGLRPILYSNIMEAYRQRPFKHLRAEKIVEDVLSEDAKILRPYKEAMRYILRYTPHLHCNATYVLLLMFFTPEKITYAERKLGSSVVCSSVAFRLYKSVKMVNKSSVTEVTRTLVRDEANRVRKFVKSLPPPPIAADEDESEDDESHDYDDEEEAGLLEDEQPDELERMSLDQLDGEDEDAGFPEDEEADEFPRTLLEEQSQGPNPREGYAASQPEHPRNNVPTTQGATSTPGSPARSYSSPAKQFYFEDTNFHSGNGANLRAQSPFATVTTSCAATPTPTLSYPPTMDATSSTHARGESYTPPRAHDLEVPIQANATSSATGASPVHETASVRTIIGASDTPVPASNPSSVTTLLWEEEELLRKIFQYGIDKGEHLFGHAKGMHRSGHTGHYNFPMDRALFKATLDAGDQLQNLGIIYVPTKGGKKKSDEQPKKDTHEQATAEAPSGHIDSWSFMEALKQHPYNQIQSPTDLDELLEDLFSGDMTRLRKYESAMERILNHAPHLHSGTTLILLRMFYTPQEIVRPEQGLGSSIKSDVVRRRINATLRTFLNQSRRNNTAKDKFEEDREIICRVTDKVRTALRASRATALSITTGAIREELSTGPGTNPKTPNLQTREQVPTISPRGGLGIPSQKPEDLATDAPDKRQISEHHHQRDRQQEQGSETEQEEYEQREAQKPGCLGEECLDGEWQTSGGYTPEAHKYSSRRKRDEVKEGEDEVGEDEPVCKKTKMPKSL
ncbi:hypothetical protein BU16DRAFT_544331 [Lophium mytilinum]|uniref:Uncharacterized protein n=1 Tax=Lophium mytilinum TaxID=390894 RepID=A0A6A6QD23_9PEZI|nr:hypothetical protein BU16DRAFT_544331 [Lophium mytilinum]